MTIIQCAEIVEYLGIVGMVAAALWIVSAWRAWCRFTNTIDYDG